MSSSQMPLKHFSIAALFFSSSLCLVVVLLLFSLVTDGRDASGDPVSVLFLFETWAESSNGIFLLSSKE